MIIDPIEINKEFKLMIKKLVENIRTNREYLYPKALDGTGIEEEYSISKKSTHAFKGTIKCSISHTVLKSCCIITDVV